MRRLLTAAVLLAAATIAQAQPIKPIIAVVDPVTGLGPSEWEALVGRIVNAESIVGEPGVIIISSVPVPLTVTCDRWEIVGRNVYKSVTGNPQEIRPFTVTYVKTRDFDGYCKQGVLGRTSLGRVYPGRITSSDGTFTNATVILFSGADQPR
jgi:hypothetical protein